MRIVKNARSAWRWFSVQLAALATIAPTSWLLIPEEMRNEIPPEWLAICGAVLGVLIIFGRLVDQGGEDGAD